MGTDAASDIDLMVIGSIRVNAIHDAVAACEKSLGREVNYSIFDAAEWRQRLMKKDPFLTDVMKNPKIFIIGDEDALRRLTGAEGD